jgi:type IV pilus assembly protein PilM
MLGRCCADEGSVGCFAPGQLTRLMQLRSRTSRSVVGLDIEPGYVTAATVHVNGGIKVEQAAGVALESGVVRDGEVADVDALASALRELFSSHGLDKRVRVGLANARIVLRTLDLPPSIEGKELAAAVQFEAQSALPMPLESAVLDFDTVGITQTPEGPRQKVVLVAARRDMVERHLAAVRQAGLRPEGIDLSAFAMIRALVPPARRATDPPVPPTLLLSVSGMTNLAVAQGRVCQFTRVVGAGLEAMALELAERRGSTLVAARRELEQVGLRHLDAPEGDSDAAMARTVLADGVRRIATEVRNSLDFYLAQEGGSPVERALLTGAAVEVPGFVDAMAAELGMPVDVGMVEHENVRSVPGGRLTVAAGLATEEAPA